MPLISIERINDHTRLGLWQIEDSIDGLLHSDPSLGQLDDVVRVFRSETRRREVLAVYALLFAMTGDRSMRIDHDELSRPLLPGFHISISHTRGYAAVILSSHDGVAVDIEYYSNRVEQVAARFVRTDEYAVGLDLQLIHWSAKETMYKLLAEEKLEYSEMRLEPFEPAAVGSLSVSDLKEPKSQMVYYRINPQYVLTYALR